MLDLVDVFPGVPILGYFEFYYRILGRGCEFRPRIYHAGEDRFGVVRGKNTVNLLALALGQYGQTPTKWQQSLYPHWAQKQIRIIEEGVDLEPLQAQPRTCQKDG